MAAGRGHSYDAHAARMEKVFIGISGLIGAGKTTLARALATELDLPVYYEPTADNIYLADFYKDLSRYSFPMQVYLLNKRFSQQQQIIWGGRGGVQDRTIYEDSVFARMLRDAGLMEERDYQTYVDLFSAMSNFMRKPNVIVHLDVTPEESLRRIKLRARDCESSISLEYLQGLYAAYNEFIGEISRVIPVIKVNWSEFRSTEEMARRIAEEYSRIGSVRVVDFGPRPVSVSPAATPTAHGGAAMADAPVTPTRKLLVEGGATAEAASASSPGGL